MFIEASQALNHKCHTSTTIYPHLSQNLVSEAEYKAVEATYYLISDRVFFAFCSFEAFIDSYNLAHFCIKEKKVVILNLVEIKAFFESNKLQ